MAQLQRFNSDDIKYVEQTPLYQGFFKLVKYRFEHRLFEGGWSGPVEREVFERDEAVAVLPYDPKRQCFVLIEQFRIGALGRGKNPWLIECVAGIADKHESLEELCHREAEEEAGLKLQKLHKALSYLSSPGGMTERLHVYLATVDATGVGGVHGLDVEGEDILVHQISLDDTRKMLDEGVIDNAATVIALQWFFLNQVQLQQQGII